MESNKLLFSAVHIFLFLVVIANAQIGNVDPHAPRRPHLLVLGSYHMANPGLDVAKSKVTDVLLPERQRQIAQLVELLSRFRPTKVAVEVSPEECLSIQEKYNDFLRGTYSLSRNESEQIGFRLARVMKLDRLYCIDWNDYPVGDISNYDYAEFAEKDPELKEFLSRSRNELQARVNKNSRALLKRSIVEQYIRLNQPSEIETSHAHYFDYVRIGRGKDYVGANYLSHWYGRNMKIFANLIRITEPDDRILVIYGSGHSKLLTQFATESRYYQVESPLRYLRQVK